MTYEPNSATQSGIKEHSSLLNLFVWEDTDRIATMLEGRVSLYYNGRSFVLADDKQSLGSGYINTSSYFKEPCKEMEFRGKVVVRARIVRAALDGSEAKEGLCSSPSVLLPAERRLAPAILKNISELEMMIRGRYINEEMVKVIDDLPYEAGWIDPDSLIRHELSIEPDRVGEGAFYLLRCLMFSIGNVKLSQSNIDRFRDKIVNDVFARYWLNILSESLESDKESYYGFLVNILAQLNMYKETK